MGSVVAFCLTSSCLKLSNSASSERMAVKPPGFISERSLATQPGPTGSSSPDLTITRTEVKTDEIVTLVICWDLLASAKHPAAGITDC